MAHIRRIEDLNRRNPLHKKAEHVQLSAPTSRSGKIAAQTKDPRIDVKVYRSKSGNYAPIGDYFVIVQFWSHAKPDFAVAAPVVLGRKSERELDFEVGVLCGAMAERLGELYGDNFDPNQAARHGSGQLARLLASWSDAAMPQG